MLEEGATCIVHCPYKEPKPLKFDGTEFQVDAGIPSVVQDLNILKIGQLNLSNPRDKALELGSMGALTVEAENLRAMRHNLEVNQAEGIPTITYLSLRKAVKYNSLPLKLNKSSYDTLVLEGLNQSGAAILGQGQCRWIRTTTG
jgi:hypothetical protein